MAAHEILDLVVGVRVPVPDLPRVPGTSPDLPPVALGYDCLVQQTKRARTMWSKGNTLGEIASALGCSGVRSQSMALHGQPNPGRVAQPGERPVYNREDVGSKPTLPMDLGHEWDEGFEATCGLCTAVRDAMTSSSGSCRMADSLPSQSSGYQPMSHDELWAWLDTLMAAGGRLAEQLENIDKPLSPWTEQILEEWEEATKP